LGGLVCDTNRIDDVLEEHEPLWWRYSLVAVVFVGRGTIIQLPIPSTVSQ
jgi:hypothetical protein